MNMCFFVIRKVKDTVKPDGESQWGQSLPNSNRGTACVASVMDALCPRRIPAFPTWLAVAGQKLSFTLSKHQWPSHFLKRPPRKNTLMVSSCWQRRALGAGVLQRPGSLQVCVMWGRPDLQKIWRSIFWQSHSSLLCPLPKATNTHLFSEHSTLPRTFRLGVALLWPGHV